MLPRLITLEKAGGKKHAAAELSPPELPVAPANTAVVATPARPAAASTHGQAYLGRPMQLIVVFQCGDAPLGLHLVWKYDCAIVQALEPGGQAAALGNVATGDYITDVAGMSVAGVGFSGILAALAARRDSRVPLRVQFTRPAQAAATAV